MAVCELLSAGLVEKDINGDILYVWSYPSVLPEQRELFLQRSATASDSATFTPFLYSQLKRNWYYVVTSEVNNSSNASILAKVEFVSLILVAKDFNPEKYEVLGNLLSKLYRKTGSPAALLNIYLAVATKGTCSEDENGTFSVKDFSAQKAFAASSMRTIIETFGMETVLIYTALILKKRIVLYHPCIHELLHYARSLPAFVWHRQDWNIVFPYQTLDERDLEELRSKRNFVAGFTDASIQSRTDLYDVIVNMKSSEITVAPHAKESLALGKVHKDIAMFIVRCAENSELSDQGIIKEIGAKTKELLNNLKSLASGVDGEQACLTLEALRERKLPPVTENFLFNLATCEGLITF